MKSTSCVRCSTCKSKIDFDPVRLVIFEKSGKKQKSYFHYFFPCWDPDYILQCFPFDRIVRAGFVVDESLVTPQMINSLKRNMDLWM